MHPGKVDEVVMGNVLSAGLGMVPARQAALGGGVPDSVPVFGVNEICGSGLRAVILVAQAIALGEAEVGVAGGWLIPRRGTVKRKAERSSRGRRCSEHHRPGCHDGCRTSEAGDH